MKYKLVLEISGEQFKGSGDSVYDAFMSTGLSWEQICAKGVATVSRGKVSYQHLFGPRILKRVFANKLTMQLWSKRLEFLLKDKETAIQSDNI